jgi:hypothetical protein
MEGMNFMDDEAIFSKVTTIMEKLQKDQELQDLAERNGLDVKNTVRLTSTSQDNIAVAMVALLLAEKAGDPKFNTLKHVGLQKRKLKAEIINAYKDQALQLIQKYKESKTGILQ